MTREEQLLSAGIADTLKEADRIAHNISGLIVAIAQRSVSDLETDSELDDQYAVFEWYIETLYIDTALLAERMNAPQLSMRIHKEFRRLDRSELRAFIHYPDSVELESPVLNRIRRYYRSLAIMTEGRVITGLDIFRTILENTPAIIKLRGIEPRSESQVQTAVFDVLKIAFNDVVRDPLLGQLLKAYKPDFGIRSLMAAAEYKFADSEKEVKTCLDGIYTDMKGYAGHYEWRTFFAVIYTTDTLINPKVIEEEFSGVRAELNWTPIVVIGKGGRSKAAKTTPSAASG